MKKIIEELELLVLGIVCVCLTIVDINLYNYNKKQKEFINKIVPLIEERDTTSSLRNYEVLTDSLNNLYKEWYKNDTSY